MPLVARARALLPFGAPSNLTGGRIVSS